jgi:hypothetical protein
MDRVVSGSRFDLVVANPPFGKTKRLSTPISWNITDASGERLLRSHRMECAMTGASALLVGNDGILASILPETVVDGSTYRPLRNWLAGSFERFDVQRLCRGEFCGKDLGLVLLLAHRISTVRIGARSGDFVGALTNPIEARHFEVNRGRMTSAETHGRGSILVVHSPGAGENQAYILRQCTIRAASGQLWVNPGDILVSRVGRSAGCASVFEESKAGVFTDCMFRVHGSNAENHEILTAAVRTGEMTAGLTSLAGGRSGR